jgi:hypothetical protein
VRKPFRPPNGLRSCAGLRQKKRWKCCSRHVFVSISADLSLATSNDKEMRGHSFLNWYLTADHIQIRYSQSLGRRRRRMYYCGGPYKEQAGTVPTYNTSIDCMLQSSTAQSLRKHKHKCAPKHRTKKLGRRAWPEEREKLVAEHILKRPREMQDTCAVSVQQTKMFLHNNFIRLNRHHSDSESRSTF